SDLRAEMVGWLFGLDVGGDRSVRSRDPDARAGGVNRRMVSVTPPVGAVSPADIEYVDQSASGLALNLIEGAVDIGAFTIFRAGSVNRRDITIRAAIIGASHVLSFATPGAMLTEMFACADAPGGANRILFGPIGDLLEATTELTFADG